jgi:hypothetical protein
VNDEPVEEQETTAVPPLAEALQELVEHLYPEPSVVDIITLDQFVYRYKLSGLGPSAVADMERAQRITRTMGDYVQTGLAEFHIGLIYLHWEQALGAINYFDDARRHWNFAKDDVAASLAEFAEGVCHHHGYQYESALANYGKVQRMINRLRTNGSKSVMVFLTELENVLQACRDDVVERIRTGEGETSTDRSLPTPPPISNLPLPFTADLQFEPEEPAAMVPVPESPVPQHVNQSDCFVWYQVVARDDLERLFPCILTDNELLVDIRSGEHEYKYKDGDLVIIKQSEGEDGILVKSLQETGNPELDYGRLVRLDGVEEQHFYSLDSQTDEVQFTPDEGTDEEGEQPQRHIEQTKSIITAEQMIGVVLGMWSKAQLIQK